MDSSTAACPGLWSCVQQRSHDGMRLHKGMSETDPACRLSCSFRVCQSVIASTLTSTWFGSNHDNDETNNESHNNERQKSITISIIAAITVLSIVVCAKAWATGDTPCAPSRPSAPRQPPLRPRSPEAATSTRQISGGLRRSPDYKPKEAPVWGLVFGCWALHVVWRVWGFQTWGPY